MPSHLISLLRQPCVADIFRYVDVDLPRKRGFSPLREMHSRKSAIALQNDLLDHHGEGFGIRIFIFPFVVSIFRGPGKHGQFTEHPQTPPLRLHPSPFRGPYRYCHPPYMAYPLPPEFLIS